jgi:diguanylate cyclase (GGDEF)-like protein
VRPHIQTRILFGTGVVVVAAAVWLASEQQRSAADQSFSELAAADALSRAMADQEAGLRELVESGRQNGLQRYRAGRRAFEAALAEARRGSPPGEDDEVEAIDAQARLGHRWQDVAEERLAAAIANGAGGPLPASLLELADEFRGVNSAFRTAVLDERRENQRRASLVAVALILLVAGLVALVGYALIDRRVRKDARWSERQARFKDALQFVRSEEEVYDVLRTHIETSTPGARSVVLNRNNSADALEPRTPLDQDSPLQGSLESAHPDDCLAIRSGRPFSRRPTQPTPLLACQVCGAVAGNTTCVPSLVRGEVIGSVLVSHPDRLAPTEHDRLVVSVAEAAPVVGHVRSLVVAELRAATDALTGLPNARTVHETVMRMVAQASRTITPLAAVLFDLDHFKHINDVYGHAKGDEVLAAVGVAATSVARESDFIGRYGGEEFLALLPNTDREGALTAAEKLRAAVAETRMPGVEGRITASFGVAVFPDDAGDATQLIRLADRALYLAKDRGRDRVETLPAATRLSVPPEPVER